jgi:ATP-dependent Clp protease ATP-binding subunit ClpX
MSVAVYNHYKRLHNNIAINKSQTENSIIQQQTNRGKLNENFRLYDFFFAFVGFILNAGIPFYTVPFDVSNNQNNLAGSTIISNSNEHGSDVIHNEQYDLKLEKSNILMLGPTGSGKNN